MLRKICLTLAAVLSLATFAASFTATPANAGCDRVYTSSGWVTRCH